jgi:unsaturated rhamnogalacturonyl hydrolase
MKNLAQSVLAGLFLGGLTSLACSKGPSGGAPPPPSDSGVTGAGGTGAGGSVSVSGGAGAGGSAPTGGRGGGAGAGTAGSGGGAGGAPAPGPDAGPGAGGADGGAGAPGLAGIPARTAVVAAMTLANNYFMAKWPDPGLAIVTDKSRASNIWTRAVYYEGLMALQAVDPQTRYYNYAVQWGTSHTWGLNNGVTTTSADDECAGQTYIDLYQVDPQPERIRDIKTNIDQRLTAAVPSDWSWIDAIQMAMPLYARLGVLNANTAYFDKMYAFYSYTKNTWGTSGLYNKTEHLWWRDQDFDPPYVEPNGQNCYWSRGNGWVYAALARVLDILPATDAHRAEYLADFQAMSEALRPVQRSDGYWNVSLHDPTDFGGKELTGTALFTYGMAWGVRKGVLAAATYGPIAVGAWNAMVANSLHSNGFLGWVQGSGKQPSDGQPVTADSVPDFEDYGLGCFLLAGSEIAKLAPP